MSIRTFRTKNYLHGPYKLGEESFIGPVPPERRMFPGDRVDAEGRVVERVPVAPLHGVLDLLNRTGQGFTPRGVPLYLFYPLDPAWPPFYVSYKERGTANLLVTVRFEHWDSGRWPRAGLAKIHCALDGSFGQVEMERRLLYDVYGVPKETMPDVDAPFPPTGLESYETVEWTHAFNVDPEGTEDVDDIFAWRTVGSATHFMIAIADVAAWVPPGCDLDNHAYALGQTLYDNGTVVRPMLPTSLSTCSASLRHDGIARPVIGLVFVIREGVVQSTTWHKYLVRLTAKHSYESVLRAPCAPELHGLLERVCGRTIDPTDSHDWVAQAMIKYNHAVAKLLSSVGLGLLRRQAGTRDETYATIASASGVKEIAMFGESAGSYCIGSALETAHSGLGLDVYCHATSPLRRYADLVNQRLLKYLQFGETWVLGKSTLGAEAVAEHLNARASAAKWLERELWFVSVLQPNCIATGNAICLKMKDTTGFRWSVYVPEWRRKLTGTCVEELTGLTPGAKVRIRAYCNLRSPVWRERIVCQLLPASSD